MNPARARAAADRNLCDSNVVFFGHSQTGEILESVEVQLVSCGFPIADFNWLVLKRKPDDFAASLQAAHEFFEARSLPFIVTLREDLASECLTALDAAGFEQCGRIPEMILDPIRRASDLMPDLEVSEIRDVGTLGTFARVAFEGFGIPVAAAPAFMTEALLELPQLRLYLGCVDGEPACTSAMVQTGPIAGIYWVATLEAFRRRGLGAAITWAAIEGGTERGCRIASLQASEMGGPVYEQMGFATPFHYLRFRRPSDD